MTANAFISANRLANIPGLPTLIAKRLKEVMEDHRLEAKDTTVFLAAHGNPNPDRPASHDTTLMMATRIYQHLPVHAILPAFIEEKPFLPWLAEKNRQQEHSDPALHDCRWCTWCQGYPNVSWCGTK